MSTKAGYMGDYVSGNADRPTWWSSLEFCKAHPWYISGRTLKNSSELDEVGLSALQLAQSPTYTARVCGHLVY